MGFDLQKQLRAAAVDGEAIAQGLDQLDSEARTATIQALPRRLVSMLFDAASGVRAIAPDDLIPGEAPVLFPVEYLGVNNMPLARYFAKPMYRDEMGRVAGRNVQFWQFLTGPGYFCVQPGGQAGLAEAQSASEQPAAPLGAAGELCFNYLKIPARDSVPDAWPAPMRNDRGLSRFVFGGMVDVVRAVSDHVLAGRAYVDGKPTDTYFLLVRSEAPATNVLPIASVA